MRKKIPLIGGIINLIESLKGDIGIIENTDVATHSISAGSYVIWKNELYKASSAIAVDDALSSSNLTAVSGGAANELNNNIHPELYLDEAFVGYYNGNKIYRRIYVVNNASVSPNNTQILTGLPIAGKIVSLSVSALMGSTGSTPVCETPDPYLRTYIDNTGIAYASQTLTTGALAISFHIDVTYTK